MDDEAVKGRRAGDPGIRKACYCCGRVIRWYGAKRYARHRCPHGTWCVSGRKGMGGSGMNHPACSVCRKVQRS